MAISSLGHECETVHGGWRQRKNIKKGDRVALEPGITCGQCYFCKSGLYNLCADVEFLATPPYHGCLQNYIAFPENMCFKLPENVTTKEGALVEPLSVGIHAARQGNVSLGDRVVILGAGCIGLVTMLACKAFGATDLIVVDVIPKRLELAKEIGATHVINAAECDVLKEIDAITDGMGCDIVIETAGTKITYSQTSYIVRRGGTIVLVGLPHRTLNSILRDE